MVSAREMYHAPMHTARAVYVQASRFNARGYVRRSHASMRALVTRGGHVTRHGWMRTVVSYARRCRLDQLGAIKREMNVTDGCTPVCRYT